MGLFVCLLTACSSDFGAHFSYRQSASVTPERLAQLRVGLPPAYPALQHTLLTKPQQIIYAYLKQGYRTYAYSLYCTSERYGDIASAAADRAALEQGTKSGADLVVIAPGVHKPVGKSVDICSSQQTTLYGALYFIKADFPLGLLHHDLTDADRKKLQTNHGIVTVGTVINSPAYNADIIPGDIITAIDDEKITGDASFDRYVTAHKNATVTLTLLRDGAVMTKTVQIGG